MAVWSRLMPTLRVARRFGVALLAVGSVIPAAVRAQVSPTITTPGHIAYLEGAVTIERDGSVETATLNVPVIAGDRLRTTAGRVDVLFPDGTALDLDEYSSVDLPSLSLMRLASGRAALHVAGPSSAGRYQIDTPAASARADGPGEYRVAVLAGRDTAGADVAVVHGVGSLTTDNGEGGGGGG